MFGKDDFIWKYEIGSNSLFCKLKIFKFVFESIPQLFFKVLKVET